MPLAAASSLSHLPPSFPPSLPPSLPPYLPPVALSPPLPPSSIFLPSIPLSASAFPCVLLLSRQDPYTCRFPREREGGREGGRKREKEGGRDMDRERERQADRLAAGASEHDSDSVSSCHFFPALALQLQTAELSRRPWGLPSLTAKPDRDSGWLGRCAGGRCHRLRRTADPPASLPATRSELTRSDKVRRGTKYFRQDRGLGSVHIKVGTATATVSY